MFIVLYRWRVNTLLERQFIAAWSEITDYFRTNYDSLGSRLHRGGDGLFYAYAQWKSEAQRAAVFKNENAAIREARAKMRAAVAESFPEVVLESIADYLV